MLAVSLLLTFAAARAGAGEESWPSLDLVALREAGRFPDPVEVTVPNSVAYHETKRFRGYPLLDLLALIPGYDALRREGYELQVVAADGYVVSIPWTLVLSGQGVLADRDLDAPAGEDWTPFTTGRKEVTPAPFFLVWHGGRAAVRGHYWPYQAVSIRLQPFAAAFGAAAPAGGDAPARRGFTLFKDNCLSCHSINLVGGTVGPELNVPRNVTEYWKLKELPAYIRDARSFHAQSKMPSFRDMLDEAAIADLIAYLTLMARQKICDSAESCG